MQESLRNFLLGPLHALTPVPDLLFGFPPCHSVGFLDLGYELLAFACYMLQIIIAELAPVFLCRTRQLFPPAYHLVPIQCFLLWRVTAIYVGSPCMGAVSWARCSMV